MSLPPPMDAWEPLSEGELTSVFEGAPVRWWVNGGHALELHVGRSWRQHSDIDVGICRFETSSIHNWLADWSLWTASEGSLARWDGETPEEGINNIWGYRKVGGLHWSFDISIEDGDDAEWAYRRDPTIRREWKTAVLHTRDEVPYIAPDIQLLFKSKSPRPRDHRDAEEVIPSLTESQRHFLEVHLAADHPWQALIGRR